MDARMPFSMQSENTGMAGQGVELHVFEQSCVFEPEVLMKLMAQKANIWPAFKQCRASKVKHEFTRWCKSKTLCESEDELVRYSSCLAFLLSSHSAHVGITVANFQCYVHTSVVNENVCRVYKVRC